MKAYYIVVLGLVLLCLGACQQDEPSVVIPTVRVISTFTATPTITPSPTLTLTPTDTPTTTLTPTLRPTETPSRIPSATFSPTPSPTPSATLGGFSLPDEPQLFTELAAQIEQANLVRTIQDLVNFVNRYTNSEPSSITGIYAARDYLANRLMTQAADCGGRAYVYEDSFSVRYQGVNSTQQNLVLEIRGATVPGNVIVVGAHYDTMSKEERTDEDFIRQPGADDNGSGISAVLELARLWCLVPRQQTVVFVLFAAEEIRTETSAGRVGSQHFATSFIAQQGWQVEAMLNLDTIGSATDTRGTIIDDLALIYSAPPITSPSRQLARRMQAAAYVQLPDFRILVERTEDRENRWGDHMSFTRAGYPAARLFEGSEDIARQDFPQDLLNDLDPDYLVKNIQVTLAFLLGESEGAAPPGDVVINGTFAFWNPIPNIRGYVVAYRQPDENNYTFAVLTPDKTGFQVPGNSVFALGTIGGNGLLGSLTQEYSVP